MRDTHTKFISFYFYTQAGNSLTGNFRNLGEAIVLLYIALHLHHWYYIGLMAIMGIPLLALTGWYSVNYMGKVMDKLSIKNGTYYAIRQFELINSTKELTAKNNELLSQILDELRK